ncbi:hypothetical protein [Caminicella sporogenes]|uniref:hypothetical protein n=1 Tax=Caminicella sporogenes TaxID=166485 RepID=UPI002541FCB8|nr:hypothetical protein [Caminicella sporogenes]WIF96091.1 hypothetical protein QNI18_05855 [Caminicella sporogenes]
MDNTNIHYLDYTQEIKDNILHCSILARSDMKLWYAFYLYLNGKKIHTTPYSDTNKFVVPLHQKGIYQVVCFIKNENGERIIKTQEKIFYPALKADVLGCNFFADLQKGNRIDINIINHDRIDTLDELSEYCNNFYKSEESEVLMLDALSFSECFVKQYFKECDDFRKNMLLNCEKNENFIKADNIEKAVQTWKKFLLAAVECYGNGKVIFFETLFHWNLTDKKKILANWILEEIYAVADSVDGVVIIKLLQNAFLINGNDSYSVRMVDKIRESLNQFMEKLYLGHIGKITVEVDLQDNILKAWILSEIPEDASVQYVFYLLRDGKVIDKTTRLSENFYCWELSQPGIYTVQGFVKYGGETDYSFSETREYFTMNEKQEFEDFMNKHLTGNDLLGQNPNLVTLKYPYHDFVLISYKDKSSTEYKILKGINAFLTQYSQYDIYKLKKIGGYENILISDQKPLKAENGFFVFSGITIYDNKFIEGDKDLPQSFMPDEIYGQIGNFSLLHICENSITVSTDYFNFSHIYYYETEEYMIVSNRYHMLLEVLAKTDISLELNVEKAKVLLSTVSVQMLHQNFSCDMDMKNVHQVPNYYDLRLSNKGWEFFKNSYYMLLRRKETFHKEIYEKLLTKAKKELIDLMSVFITDEHYERIVIDLTGGLDSRMVYAIATNFQPEIRKKFYINSYAVPNSNDLEIANELNSIYCFPFVNKGRIMEKQNPYDMDNLMRSFEMGIYFSFNPIQYRNQTRNEISFKGACGEILARPYICRNFYGMPEECAKEDKEFLEYMAHKYSPFIMVDFNKGFKSFINFMLKEFEDIPVDHPFEKIDRHYLMFRHAYHFDAGLTYYSNQAVWYPLQSKTLFRLHHMTHNIFKSIKLQLDMLNHLNPIMTAVRFDDKRDNDDFANLKEDLYYSDVRFKDMYLNLKNDLTLWKKANENKAKSTKIVTPQEKHEDYQNVKRQDLLLDSLLYNFQKLMRSNPILKEDIGLALYYFIINNKDKPSKIRYLYNKITSLTDQMSIFRII